MPLLGCLFEAKIKSKVIGKNMINYLSLINYGLEIFQGCTKISLDQIDICLFPFFVFFHFLCFSFFAQQNV